MALDDTLRDALAPQSPPPGFEARVMDRIARGEGPDLERRSGQGGRGTTRWLAVAAAVLIAVGGGGYYEHRRSVQRAEHAIYEVRVALEIASEKLATVQRHVRESAQREIR